MILHWCLTLVPELPLAALQTLPAGGYGEGLEAEGRGGAAFATARRGFSGER